MPYLDDQSNNIFIRIIYDGAPAAGKTTNLEKLADRISLQRRGELHSPGNSSERTAYFDWLDITAGYVEGRRLRCQLLSVPGQAMLAARRSYLLDTADAVVYVADSRKSELGRNRNMIDDMQSRLARQSESEGAVPIPIILQANKQDLDDAMTAKELARELGLSPTVPVREAVASENDGVLEVFMLAVRLAADRVRAHVAEQKLATGKKEYFSHEALFEEMQKVDLGSEDPLEKLVVAAEQAAGARQDSGDEVSSQNMQAAVFDIETGRTVVTPSEPETVAPSKLETATQLESETRSISSDQPVSEKTVSPSSLADEALSLAEQEVINEPALPVSEADSPFPEVGIPAGFLWPPVTARAVLAAVETETKLMSQTPLPWCPTGWFEWTAGENWVLHTHTGKISELSAGRAMLMDKLRLHSRLGRHLPEGRVIALVADKSSWRLWVISPNSETIGKVLYKLASTDNISKVVEKIQQAIAEVRLLCDKANEKQLLVSPSLQDIELTRDTVKYLGEVKSTINSNGAGSSPEDFIEGLREFVQVNPGVREALTAELEQQLSIV